jgi:hypothetical protein
VLSQGLQEQAVIGSTQVSSSRGGNEGVLWLPYILSKDASNAVASRIPTLSPSGLGKTIRQDVPLRVVRVRGRHLVHHLRREPVEPTRVNRSRRYWESLFRMALRPVPSLAS